MSTPVQTATLKQSHSKRELSESCVASRGSNNKRFVVSVQDDEVLSDNRANAADFFNFCLLISQPSKSKGRSSRSALFKNRTLARATSSDSIAYAIDAVLNDTSSDVQNINDSDTPRRLKADLASLLGNKKPSNKLCGVELHKYLIKSLLCTDVVNKPGFCERWDLYWFGPN